MELPEQPFQYRKSSIPSNYISMTNNHYLRNYNWGGEAKIIALIIFFSLQENLSLKPFSAEG
jgi:hypothetical protein